MKHTHRPNISPTRSLSCASTHASPLARRLQANLISRKRRETCSQTVRKNPDRSWPRPCLARLLHGNVLSHARSPRARSRFNQNANAASPVLVRGSRVPRHRAACFTFPRTCLRAAPRRGSLIKSPASRTESPGVAGYRARYILAEAWQ